MPGGRRPRPSGRPYTFACRGCLITLHDGVDYTWCPRCNREVDWIDGRKHVSICTTCDLLVNERQPDDTCPHCDRPLTHVSGPLPADEQPAPPSSLSAIARTLGLAVIVIQAVLAALVPHAFPYLAWMLVIAQVVAVLFVSWLAINSGELRDLVAYHQTRVIHGLEHATAKVLEERGLEIRSGQTMHGMFTLALAHDGASYEHLEARVREASADAISRIRFGEHTLAYDRRCGTSLLVGFSLMAIAIAGAGIAALILGMPVGYNFALTVAAGLVARALEQPAGLAAQRWLTVSTDFASAVVTRVDKRVSADGNTLTAIVMIDVVPRARDVDAVAPVSM